ncbi:MAG: hypothetical protein HYV60_11345 [Planctomycetia bacterium]|nr:hypothetical protein [Planctomycetia bacterium]
MPPRRLFLRFANRVGLVTVSLLLTFVPLTTSAQDRSWKHEMPANTAAERLPAETAITADIRMPQVEANSIIVATLSFAVGFGVCLLLVHYMLPALVHVQCIEIVREYLDYARRESDIRVVVLDRESQEPLQRPRRVATRAAEVSTASSYESQHHFRVDQPEPPASYAPVAPAKLRSDDTPGSMLSQIYEQNLQLRDQLRKQSRSVKQ